MNSELATLPLTVSNGYPAKIPDAPAILPAKVSNAIISLRGDKFDSTKSVNQKLVHMINFDYVYPILPRLLLPCSIDAKLRLGGAQRRCDTVTQT